MEAWQSVQFSRHPARPTSRDHVDEICDYFFELRGDGCGKDDKAVITGVATISRFRIALAAIDKGKGISERKLCRFGMPNPEGFRKTRRLFALAEKLSLPLLCLVDTPGAFPGHEAEEAGQAHAISKNLARLFSLATPIITVFIGEGGSGGALALGVGDAVLIMEHAYFSVISPEGCASILWKDASRAPQVAHMLRMTARELLELGLVDAVIPEPPGGAHRDPTAASSNLRHAIVEHLSLLDAVPISSLLERRRLRYRRLGFYAEILEAQDAPKMAAHG